MTLSGTPCVPQVATVIGPKGIIKVEIGPQVLLRILGDVAGERAAALVQALQGLPWLSPDL